MIYFSLDIETNGLFPGVNSMISLGAAAIDVNAKQPRIASTFKVNLNPLRDYVVDEDTMNWWKQFPIQYMMATVAAEDPADAMRSFDKWVTETKDSDKPVGAAWKPGFDLAFINHYSGKFLNKNIFGRAGSGLDIKTLTAVALNKPFSEVKIAEVPLKLKEPYYGNHTHDAREDAIEQAFVLYNARKMLKSKI